MKRTEWKQLIETVYPNKSDRRQMTAELRYALTGQNIGPDLYSICEILGKEKVISRISSYLDFMARSYIS